MRKLPAIILALVASLAVAGIAYAIDTNQNLTVKTTGRVGSKSKPKPLKIFTNITLHAKDASKDGTFGTTSTVIYYDKYIKFNTGKFPKCGASTVATNEKACPRGSKVGGGSADAVAGAGGRIKVHPTINAYNGGGGVLLLKLNRGSGDQIDTSGVIPAKLARGGGGFGSKLVAKLPSKFYQPIRGLYATLTRFTVTINATYKRTPYAASTGCKGGKYKYKGTFTYTDGTSKTVGASSKC